MCHVSPFQLSHPSPFGSNHVGSGRRISMPSSQLNSLKSTPFNKQNLDLFASKYLEKMAYLTSTIHLIRVQI
ncbi:hypothetical protein L6452_22612 [Arctium lappa]|uniref:Uncharacterized protein n=1 Tax=Arctium lappa TaxID=4217 RepID=A0ACB9B093_ARCLA|nr:hypothetical protein L6452_22612 [Arctium lappa]